MSDPAVEAAQRANEQFHDDGMIMPVSVAAAREALKPIRKAMEVARTRYEMLEVLVDTAESPDELARFTAALAELQEFYDSIAPLVFTTEELNNVR